MSLQFNSCPGEQLRNQHRLKPPSASKKTENDGNIGYEKDNIRYEKDSNIRCEKGHHANYEKLKTHDASAVTFVIA